MLAARERRGLPAGRLSRLSRNSSRVLLGCKQRHGNGDATADHAAAQHAQAADVHLLKKVRQRAALAVRTTALQRNWPTPFFPSHRDTLRTAVEKLSIPGVRRLIVIDPETTRVEGIVSLCDVASYLLS